MDPLHDALHTTLLEKEILSKENLKKAVSEAHNENVPLADVLVKRNYVPFSVVAEIAQDTFGVESCEALQAQVSEELVKKVSEQTMRKYQMLPLALDDDELTVALADPSNLIVLDDLQTLTGCRIVPVFALGYQIADKIETIFSEEVEEDESSAEEEFSAIITEAEDNLEFIETEESEVGELLKSVNETPIIRITNKLLLESIKRGASDIFIEPWEKSMRIRCRVDGLLEEMKSPPKSMATSIVSRIKVMSDLDIAERRLPQDGRFKIKYQKREVDFRVSVLPTCFGEKVCLRVLDKTAQAQNIEKLGFHPDELVRIKASAEKPHGMLLVTGPTGSGKTSTLYSVLNYLDDPGVNITTVEDPVEYMMYGVNQVNCKEAVGMTFAAALRSILRQDPDIVMIGEIRDFETMDIAIKAALTGHLVLSTLHTNDACSAITRMVNMNIEPFLIASSVLMISAQRLVRRLCPECKEAYTETDDFIKKYDLKRLADTIQMYRPVGCDNCHDSGYKGRMVITEVLVMSDEVKNLIMESATAEEIKKQARKEGMTTLRESGLRKMAEGMTSLEEVLRVSAEDTEE